MELGLRGRVAAIMGGSAGIGKAIAAGLAAEGTNLVLMARDRDNLEGTAREITDRWPGDSVSFPPATPHRMWAVGDERAVAIWAYVDNR